MVLDSWLEFGVYALSYWLYTSVWRRKSNKKYITNSVNYENNRKLGAHTMLAGFVSDIDARNFVSQSKCSPYCKNVGENWTYAILNSFESISPPLIPLQSQASSMLPSIRSSKVKDPSDSDVSVSDINSVGYFSCQFEIPVDWKNREVRIVFPTVSETLHIRINGQYAGVSEEYAVSSEFVIDEFLKFEHNNRLEVFVMPSEARASEIFIDVSTFDDVKYKIWLVCLPRPVKIMDFRYVH
jgi:hypothetical protein